MTSQRHIPADADPTLAAAREAILAVGWSRTTLTDVARRAGVSRMTIYRRWGDMRTLVADLMTVEVAGLVESVEAGGDDALTRLVNGITGIARATRENPLLARIIELDPEVLLPYLLERAGRSQEQVVEVLADQIAAGQEAGEIRRGDAGQLARALVLAGYGFVLSAHTLGDPDTLDAELGELARRYLQP